MKVRLLQNVMENGGVKCSRRRRQPDGSYAIEVPFVLGAIIEMSDASAVKYIDRGIAERYVETAPEVEARGPQA